MTEPQEAYSFKGVTETEMFNCGKFMMFSFTGPVQEGITSNNSVPRAERIFRKDFTQQQKLKLYYILFYFIYRELTLCQALF